MRRHISPQKERNATIRGSGISPAHLPAYLWNGKKEKKCDDLGISGPVYLPAYLPAYPRNGQKGKKCDDLGVVACGICGSLWNIRLDFLDFLEFLEFPL